MTLEQITRETFNRQQAMKLIGAQLASVEPGVVEIALPFSEAITQQHGFIHAGIVTTALDSACGYAAWTMMPPGAGVLTVELKVSLLRPAAGERFRMRGEVIKPGRTLYFTEGRAYAVNGTQEKLIATISATMMVMEGSNGFIG